MQYALPGTPLRQEALCTFTPLHQEALCTFTPLCQEALCTFTFLCHEALSISPLYIYTFTSINTYIHTSSFVVDP